MERFNDCSNSFYYNKPTYDLPEMRLMTIGGNVGYYSSGLNQVSCLGNKHPAQLCPRVRS